MSGVCVLIVAIKPTAVDIYSVIVEYYLMMASGHHAFFINCATMNGLFLTGFL